MGRRFSMIGRGCLITLGLSFAACVDSINVGGGGDGGPPGPLPKADKIDLLLVVDNSRSMADKQEILAKTTQDFIHAVTNPPCMDANGQVGQTPASPLDPCPPGQIRRHTPVKDMHVGVISTSIGGHGADSCPDIDSTSGQCATTTNTTNNDRAHLLSRTDVCGTQPGVPTHQDQGFLAWDLNGSQTPPGTNDAEALAQSVAAMVLGVGQIGCGYESQLESWYRFLVDPSPYQSISAVNGVATPSGVDNELLAQRANFLRPDSMLVILQLTDENDCSLKESGQFYMAAQLRNPGGTPFRLPRPRAECATNPNDPCCKSCGEDPGTCPADPTCSGPLGQVAQLTDAEDALNLRCFDQKRRFGIDFLYPVQRYVDALTQPTIADRDGNIVPNPIFSDLDPEDSNHQIRDPGLVFMTTISGVPWQEIARSSADLTQGFQNATEMEQNGTWNAILENPSTPFMTESIMPRAGISTSNSINGGERTIANFDDLQYACTFPLTTPRDCSDPSLPGCDCFEPNNDNPLCAPNPNNGNQRTLQVAAKAYPSTRNIRLVHDLGEQGILTSICPAQIDDDTADDYAYRPVVRSLIERISSRL